MLLSSKAIEQSREQTFRQSKQLALQSLSFLQNQNKSHGRHWFRHLDSLAVVLQVVVATQLLPPQRQQQQPGINKMRGSDSKGYDSHSLKFVCWCPWSRWQKKRIVCSTRTALFSFFSLLLLSPSSSSPTAVYSFLFQSFEPESNYLWSILQANCILCLCLFSISIPYSERLLHRYLTLSKKEVKKRSEHRRSVSLCHSLCLTDLTSFCHLLLQSFT